MPLVPSAYDPIGTLAVAPVALGPPPPLLADSIDPETGDYLSLTVGADPIDAQVQLAVTTIRGSGAAVREDGLRVAPRKMTDDLAATLEGDVRLALRRLVESGAIRFVELAVTERPEAAQGEGYVRYLNLRAADPKPRSALVTTQTRYS